ncbi:hypothetical protein GF420_12895 [candidate division GN15 bacterium]|nr:hypothetical protein [candidate division GN15 bacterium]
MKRALLIFCVLLLVPVMGYAQEENPFRGVIAGAAWTDDGFDEQIDFGMQTGFMTAVDRGKGLWLRTLYSRWNFQPDEPIQSLSVDAIIEFDVGSGFTVYGVGESDNYVGGDNKGTDFGGGFGAAWRFHTFGEDSWLVPGNLALFVEVDYVDAGTQPTGSFIGAKLGLHISRPYGE